MNTQDTEQYIVDRQEAQGHEAAVQATMPQQVMTHHSQQPQQDMTRQSQQPQQVMIHQPQQPQQVMTHQPQQPQQIVAHQLQPQQYVLAPDFGPRMRTGCCSFSRRRASAPPPNLNRYHASCTSSQATVSQPAVVVFASHPTALPSSPHAVATSTHEAVVVDVDGEGEVTSRPPSSPHAVAPSTHEAVVVDVDDEDEVTAREVRVHNARVSFGPAYVSPWCAGACRTNLAVTQLFFVCADNGNERLVDTLSPGQVVQLPFPPSSIVVARDETGAELTRWTVLKRRARKVQSKTMLGAKYTKTVYDDPEVQNVVIGDWAGDWRRVLRPKELDYDLAYWDEPKDDPTTGKVTAPFAERFCYYVVRRHQVLNCYFVKTGDSFSPGERKAGLVNTVMWTWAFTSMLQASGTSTVAVVFIVALIITPIGTLFTLASRIECLKIEWGRVVTVPIFLTGLILVIVFSINFATATTAGSFFASLFLEWFLFRPGGIALRVYLYGIGWQKWFGIGPKNKWCLDKAAASAGMG